MIWLNLTDYFIVNIVKVNILRFKMEKKYGKQEKMD